MTATRTISTARYCPHCAYNNHRLCTGHALAHGGTCECADRDHDPEVRVAAAMRRYQRSDLRHFADEILATQWRQKDNRKATT